MCATVSTPAVAAVTLRYASLASAAGEWLSPTLAPLLIAIILLAATGTLALFTIGLIGYLRRPTVRYRVLTIVLGLLVVRSIVGMATVFELVPMTAHHLLEHGIDLLVAGLLLYLVFRSGNPTGSASEREEASGESASVPASDSASEPNSTSASNSGSTSSSKNRS